MPDKSTDKTKEKISARSVLQKIALAAWAAIIILVIVRSDSITADVLLSYIPENIWLAVLMMMGFFALKTLSVFFYSGLLFTLSGVIFDLPVALAVNALGMLVMLLEGYAIGRAGGQKLIEDISAKHPRFARFNSIKDDRPFLFALLIRFLKVINYDLGSMYMGASGVRLAPYLGGSMLGIFPEAALFALAGSGLADLDAMPAAAAGVIYVIMTLTSVLLLRHMMRSEDTL